MGSWSDNQLKCHFILFWIKIFTFKLMTKKMNKRVVLEYSFFEVFHDTTFVELKTVASEKIKSCDQLPSRHVTNLSVLTFQAALNLSRT